MSAIIEGFYKKGRIELVEVPNDLREGRVRVIVLPQPQAKPCYLTFGKYGGKESTLEDFKEAQWRGEEELNNPHGQ